MTVKKEEGAGHQGLRSVILAAWKTEIRRITVQGQPWVKFARPQI
jgi:hypothetical protein